MSARDVQPLLPRYRWGTIGGGSNREVTVGPGYEFYQLVPLDIIEIYTELGIGQYSFEPLYWRADTAIERFWHCVALLQQHKVDRISLRGAPISAQLGRERVLELLSEATARTGVPCDGPLEAVIHALNHLGVTEFAIASRWSAQLNASLSRYFSHAGINVVAATERGQRPKEALDMTLEDGIKLSLEVAREAVALNPTADAILIIGGAALSLPLVPELEAEFGKPVLTSFSAEVFSALVSPGVIEPMPGWGRLLGGA